MSEESAAPVDPLIKGAESSLLLVLARVSSGGRFPERESLVHVHEANTRGHAEAKER